MAGSKPLKDIKADLQVAAQRFGLTDGEIEVILDRLTLIGAVPPQGRVWEGLPLPGDAPTPPMPHN